MLDPQRLAIKYQHSCLVYRDCMPFLSISRESKRRHACHLAGYRQGLWSLEGFGSLSLTIANCCYLSIIHLLLHTYDGHRNNGAAVTAVTVATAPPDARDVDRTFTGPMATYSLENSLCLLADIIFDLSVSDGGHGRPTGHYQWCYYFCYDKHSIRPTRAYTHKSSQVHLHSQMRIIKISTRYDGTAASAPLRRLLRHFRESHRCLTSYPVNSLAAVTVIRIVWALQVVT